MSCGRTHDYINLILGAIIFGSLILINIQLKHSLVFFGGLLFSTFIFSPDTDLRVFRRSGVLRPFLYLYPKIFSHRGISHSIFFGTLTRIIYLTVMLFIIASSLFLILYLPLGDKINWKEWLVYIDPIRSSASRNLFFYFFTGMFVGDLSHILTDYFSSLRKNIFKKIFG